MNSIYSRKNLPKINNWVYVITLNQCESIGTHWITMHVNSNNATYFDS